MLTGSVLGGVIAQATNLGVPYLIRAGLLGVTMVIAWWFMHDIGFTPRAGARAPSTEVRSVLEGSIDGGLRNPPVRWLMLAAPFTVGVGIYAFYAFQPYLLQLYGDPTAYGVAGPGGGDRRRRPDRRRPDGHARPPPVQAPDRCAPHRPGSRPRSCSRWSG